MRLWRLLLEPVTEGGGGTEAKPVETKVEVKGTEATPDLSKAAEGLVAKHGDSTAALKVLLGENHSYRDQLRETKARLPAEGTVVLTADQAKDWDRYKAIGKPDDLKTALTERDTFRAEAGNFRKAEVHRSAAEIHGYKPGVLATLAKDLEITIGDRLDKDGKPVLDKAGQPVKTAFVKGEGDKLTPLDEHAKAAWADFLPSLQVQADTKARPAGTPRIEPPARTPASGQGAETPRRRPIASF